MTKHNRIKTTIEINGKVYDPRTGRQVGGSNIIKPTVARQSIDGVSGVSPISHKPAVKPAPKPASHHKVTKQRPAPKHAKRQVSKSQTLVRTGLSKPTPKHHASNNKTVESVIQNNLINRAERAKKIQKSRLVQRFNMQAEPAPTVPKKYQPMPVAKPRKQHPQTKHLSATNQHIAKHSKNTINDFEEAVQNATSHLEKMPKKSRKSRLKPKASKANIAMASIAAVLLVGFFAWQNTPNLQMRLAASRASIPASLPGYSPAGYGIKGGIQSEPGKVTVSFQSRTDDKSFSITEQASDWNDDTLYANYVEPREGQIYESNDKKIYLIDNSNATWVENGIWYRIEGSSDLTTDQLQRIANSL